ncbi:MAG: hypothetical protein ABW220_00905, partial [Burkholderiaceae bacterium]
AASIRNTRCDPSSGQRCPKDAAISYDRVATSIFPGVPMTARHHRALIATLAAALWLSACSNDTAVAADSKPGAAASAPEPSGPTGDPCAMVSDSGVRKAFADAKAGKRDHSLDKYDIATCTWDTPTNMVVLQLFKAAGSAHDEVRSRADGVIDPVKPGAGKNFRYETVASLGDEATVIAESGDQANGIFNDLAVLGIRKGEKMVVIFAHSLIDGDRAKTIQALEALGKKAASRF